MHAQGVQEGHSLLGGSIARPSEQPLSCGDLWPPPERARVHKSAQTARARRLKVRGDPTTAMRGCSNFAARPAAASNFVTSCPLARVAAHQLPSLRLALSGEEAGYKQSGRACSLLSVLGRADEVRRRRIHSLAPDSHPASYSTGGCGCAHGSRRYVKPSAGR